MRTLSPSELITATGGMQWESFPRSTHVEDRRSPAAKARDETWWSSLNAVPLPRPRPKNL